nr:MAG TPA: hypothetical protein [Caudoviricetes sp.]
MINQHVCRQLIGHGFSFGLLLGKNDSKEMRADRPVQQPIFLFE